MVVNSIVMEKESETEDVVDFVEGRDVMLAVMKKVTEIYVV
jgi:hypothetical protein